MSNHSKLPPSSAARRVACPGSRALEEKYKTKEDSFYAKEGEAAHWLAAHLLRGLFPNTEISKISKMHSNGELFTSEMYESAEIYFNFVKLIVDGFKDFTFQDLHIEERIDISHIHPDCWGTPDCWLFAGSELHIWDYKYGHGVVEVFENWQLIEYAAGILDPVKIYINERIWVNFHIVQPRSFHRNGPIRTWRIKASELQKYFKILQTSELEAFKDNAICRPSPQCKHCLGRHACEALQRAALSNADLTLANTPWELTPNSMGNELRYLKNAAALLDARITGLEEEVTALLHKGNLVPFFKLEQTPGRDYWKVEDEEIITLGKILNCDLSKPTQAITPKQAIKAGMPKEVIDNYTEKSKGSSKLVLDEGKVTHKIFGMSNEM